MPHTQKPKRQGIAVFALGCLFSAVLAWWVSEYNQRQLASSLLELERETVEKISSTFYLYQYGLRGSRGIFVTHGAGETTLGLYRAYANTREVDLEFPGSRGFGFIRRVPVQDVPDYLAWVNSQRPDGFEIKELSPNTGERFVIEMIEPEYRNRQAVGLDIASESNRRSAALRAAISGQPRLTDPITLVQATGAVEQGFLLLMPVQDFIEENSTEAEKIAATEGWVYTPLVVSEVLQGAGVENELIQFELANETEGGNWQSFYKSEANEANSISTILSRSEEFPVFGRNWKIQIAALPALEQSLNLTSPVLVFMPGVFASFLLGLLITQTGISRHKDVQRYRDKAQLSAIVSGSADGIFSCTNEGEITSMNESAHSLLQLPPENRSGSNLFELLFTEESRDKQLSKFRRVIAEGTSARQEVQITRPDGQLPLDALITYTPIKDELDHQLGVAVHLTDISKLKQALRVLERSQDELERKVAIRTSELDISKQQAEAANLAKSEFLANMSHEIRTPLSAVLGLSYLLEQDNLTVSQSDKVRKIQTAGRALLGIVNDVLDLSKIEAGELKLERRSFDLSDLINDTRNMMQASAQSKGLELRIEAYESTLKHNWVGDEVRIKQILINLINNAIKFTEKGLINVQIGCDPLPDCNDRIFKIEVQDSGIGMTDEAQRHLFRPFNQADTSITRRFGGTGLGLSIVKQLVDLMDGEIAVRSKLGQGTTFTAQLKLGTETRIENLGGKSPILRPLEVLVAEDDPNQREHLVSLCKSFGWNVNAVGDGEALLVRAIERQNGPNPLDCLIIDWRLPKMDGLTALAALSQELKGMRAPGSVVVSAHDVEVIRQQEHFALADSLIIKPVDHSTLFNQVNNAVVKHTGSTARVVDNTVLNDSVSWLEGLTILLVEDNELNVEICQFMLETEGAKVQVANNGLEAVEWLQQNPEGADAVLMDMQMPVLDGCQASMRIRNLLGLTDLPIIALTAGALVSQKEAALQAGMDDFLTKPFEVDKIRHTILRHINARQERS